MQDTRVLTIGTDAVGWTLSGAYQIAGITIDNKSGSWLLLPADNTYIPPYTLGFAHTFQPTVGRVDVRFVGGPAGQVSTNAGDSPIVTIYSDPVGNSVGTQSQPPGFITQFTPTLANLSDFAVPTSGNLLSQVLFAGVPGLRYRVLTVGVAYNMVSGGPIQAHFDSPVSYSILQGGTLSVVHGMLTRDNPSNLHTYPFGVDNPGVGGNITFTGKAIWATMNVRVITTVFLI